MNDKIQVIPPGLEKYLGIGKMILPSVETLGEELQIIPEGKLTTLSLIRESIAKKFGVTTACPKTSLKVLKDIMEQSDSGAYKVLNGNGELISKDLGIQAELLQADGHEIDFSKSKPKVKDFKMKILTY